MKFVRRGLAGMFTLAALVLLLAWAAGAVATDRFIVTQYLDWLPTWAVLIVSGIALVFARAFAPRVSRKRAWSRTRTVATVLWLAIGAYLLLIDFRIANVAAPTPPGRPLRILHWNVTNIQDVAGISAVLAREQPDIAVLVDVWAGVSWQPVIDSFADTRSIAWEPGMLILSRVPIRRYAFTWLGLAELPPDNPIKWTPRPRRGSDPGRAMFLEIDSPLFERELVLTVLDLPSDWRKSRWKMAAHSRHVMDTWSGLVTHRDDRGQTRRLRADAQGFPRPDIVVGDFNIPRGSASLDLLSPGMTHAFSQAGYGYAASFPNTYPLLHIDHTFLGPPLRAARYRLLDPGLGSTHRVQVTDVVRNP